MVSTGVWEQRNSDSPPSLNLTKATSNWEGCHETGQNVGGHLGFVLTVTAVVITSAARTPADPASSRESVAAGSE
jgi:hypothetical protein